MIPYGRWRPVAQVRVFVEGFIRLKLNYNNDNNDNNDDNDDDNDDYIATAPWRQWGEIESPMLVIRRFLWKLLYFERNDASEYKIKRNQIKAKLLNTTGAQQTLSINYTASG